MRGGRKCAGMLMIRSFSGTPATRALMPVHLFGRAVDMTRVMDIANRHNLKVVEDCAQATGATWNDRAVGSFGDVGCFSFFPTKNLGAAGDGGCVSRVLVW